MNKVNGGSFLLGVFVAAMLGLVGGGDYDEERAQQKEYCKNVEAGVWYDSQENFNKKCKSPVDAK